MDVNVFTFEKVTSAFL